MEEKRNQYIINNNSSFDFLNQIPYNFLDSFNIWHLLIDTLRYPKS